MAGGQAGGRQEDRLGQPQLSQRLEPFRWRWGARGGGEGAVVRAERAHEQPRSLPCVDGVHISLGVHRLRESQQVGT